MKEKSRYSDSHQCEHSEIQGRNNVGMHID